MKINISVSAIYSLVLLMACLEAMTAGGSWSKVGHFLFTTTAVKRDISKQPNSYYASLANEMGHHIQYSIRNLATTLDIAGSFGSARRIGE